MKKFVFSISAFFVLIPFLQADITVKPDGTVSCTGQCDGRISSGSYVICQGAVCVTIKLPKSNESGKRS